MLVYFLARTDPQISASAASSSILLITLWSVPLALGCVSGAASHRGFYERSRHVATCILHTAARAALLRDVLLAVAESAAKNW